MRRSTGPSVLRTLAVASCLAVGFTATDARAGTRTAFPYRDAEFLWAGESEGAMLFVPDALPAGGRAPLVVLLHGVNVDHGLHMWLGGRGEPDLGPMIDEMVTKGTSLPFILAAPSQTRGAMSGRHMWQDFDLDDFAGKVADHLAGRAEIDRDTVFVLGHSGGGCNPDGGLLRVARAPSRIVPRALLAIDTCMDEESGAALGNAPFSAAVVVLWQSEIWPRPLDRFLSTFRGAAIDSGHDEPQVDRIDGLAEPVHETILVETFRSLIPALLARSAAARSAQ